MEMNKIQAEKKGDREKQNEYELHLDIKPEEEPNPYSTIGGPPQADSKIKAEKEEEEAQLYSALCRPSEDVYADAHFKSSPGGQTEGNAAQYRVGCIVLSVICFVLLLAVIVLSVGGRREVAAVENNISSAVTYSLEQCQTLVSPTTVCPDTERAPEDRTSPSATTCSLEQCQDHLTKTQPVLCPEMEETTADSRTCPPTETCTVEQCQAHVTSAPCVCPDTERAPEDRTSPSATTCSLEQCQDHLTKTQPVPYGCMQCANGWLTLDRSCFYLSTTRMDWAESRSYCAERGASLAVITSQEVQDFLTKKGSLKYWIGLRRVGRTWSWVTNAALRAGYWAENHSIGNCALINTRGPPQENWVKGNCVEHNYFICYLQF